MISFELLTNGTIVALIIGLVEVAKKIGLRRKFAPFLSIILGILFSFGSNYFADEKWYISLVSGIILGLTSIGIYSSIKNTTQALRKNDF